MQDPNRRIRSLKTALVCLVLCVVGVSLMSLARVLADQPSPTWLSVVPWNELGAVLFGAGLLGVGLDSWLQREDDAIAEAQLRRVLQEHAPAIRDAVIQGFAFEPGDLERVATPETLDQIVRNGLALRLNDAEFASELYGEIRDQAIRAAERWHDVNVQIRLSMLRGAPKGSAPAYVSTVRWEYKVVPAHATRRFTVVSDREEYREIAQDPADTSAWYLRPRTGLDPSERLAYELVQFTVNGQERPIRRHTRKGGQTYTASVGTNIVQTADPVTISYTYRTVLARDGHLLHLDVEQPTRGIRVELDYSDTDIDYVKIVDFIASTTPSRIIESPKGLPDRSVGVEFDGWLMPRSGVAFVWVHGSNYR